jgi:hypothetical protein
MINIKDRVAFSFSILAAMLVTAPALAADFNCAGPQMGELFIDTQSGNVTKGAEETLKVEIATENSNYRFEFKGKKNKFKALINRANGQIELDEACTPECWGGPIFGTCTVVKAKF